MNHNSNNKGGTAEQIKRAKIEAELSKQRLSSTATALQQRLRPGSLANDAWTGVREKSGALADDALQAVKDRPMTTSGIIAALVVFLAREPLWDAISGLFRDEEDDDLVTATLVHDENYDLASPKVSRSVKEGVSA